MMRAAVTYVAATAAVALLEPQRQAAGEGAELLLLFTSVFLSVAERCCGESEREKTYPYGRTLKKCGALSAVSVFIGLVEENSHLCDGSRFWMSFGRAAKCIAHRVKLETTGHR
jgi:hypothetical protein